ncbi:serine/threonine-protein kinase RsbW [Clostridiales Family XIII bacterium PM5-7]
MDKLKFVIPGKPEYLTMVRLAISSIAHNAGFDLDDAEDMKTAVEEACKNVSCHGFEGFSDQYEVECNVEKGRVEIIVKDACDQHSLQKIAKPCVDCPKEGDLGIYVIKTLMNEVEFGRADDGHKSIRMVKNL